MDTLFIENYEPDNEDYIVLRDSVKHQELRNYCDRLWENFREFADPEFPYQFANDLFPRFWEMYLGTTILNLGFDLIPSGSSFGPDLHFLHEGRNYWIEATAPNEGFGRDSVPTLQQHSGYDPVPLDKLILRFTHSIKKKKDKYDNYICKGIVGEDDVLIIGINGGCIGLTIFDSPLPSIVKSVYPVGNYQIEIDKESMEIVNSGYTTRYEIEKQSGSKVPTSAFINREYSLISGLIYSDAWFLDSPDPDGHEMIYIHNSEAINPTELNWFRTGIEYYKEDNSLIKVVRNPKT